ncbi:MAG TPA: hypothetical protein VMT64_04040, partial [Candidatus Binataceae bacterium]|nr:hypothetical protein [Candidatus Binataceae bacterium]
MAFGPANVGTRGFELPRAVMDRRANLGLSEFRPPGCVLHHGRARLAELMMLYVHRRADSQSGIAGRGLNIHFIKSCLTDYFTVSHTIECHTARQAQLAVLCDTMKIAQTLEHDLV